MATGLGEAGARVAINYANNEDAARKTLVDLRARGIAAELFRADVTREDEVAHMTREIASSLGPVDIAVLNATCDQPHAPIEEYDWAFYQTMVDFFVKSPYLVTRACLRHMKAQRWGRIINIGSEVFQRGVPNFTAYVAAKGGQNGFTRGLATELAPFGITVNMISPGWIPVERHEKEPEEWKVAYKAQIPAGRWGVPRDVAGLCAFLASDAASFITGQNICVNGGMTVA